MITTELRPQAWMDGLLCHLCSSRCLVDRKGEQIWLLDWLLLEVIPCQRSWPCHNVLLLINLKVYFLRLDENYKTCQFSTYPITWHLAVLIILLYIPFHLEPVTGWKIIMKIWVIKAASSFTHCYKPTLRSEMFLGWFTSQSINLFAELEKTAGWLVRISAIFRYWS